MSEKGRKTILLVEDEVIIAMAEKMSIESFGYDVVTAVSGDEAVEKTLNQKVDLILMDIDLGNDMDGTQAAREILRHKFIPIVFLTSHSEREMVEKVRGITRYGYLLKNSGDFILESSIEMAFELYNANVNVIESDTRMKLLIDTIPDMVWFKDADGVFLSCNPKFEAYYGASENEIRGKTDYDFVNTRQADFFRKNDKKAMAAGKPTMNEEWIEFSDGKYRVLLETIKTPVYDRKGRIVGVLGIGRDITKRYRAESALIESEQRLNSALDNIPAVIVIFDIKKRIRYANRQIESITGMKPDDFYGQPVEKVWGTLSENWSELIDETIKTGETSSSRHLYISNDETQELLLFGIPLKNGKGEIVEIMGIIYSEYDFFQVIGVGQVL